MWGLICVVFWCVLCLWGCVCFVVGGAGGLVVWFVVVMCGCFYDFCFVFGWLVCCVLCIWWVAVCCFVVLCCVLILLVVWFRGVLFVVLFGLAVVLLLSFGCFVCVLFFIFLDGFIAVCGFVVLGGWWLCRFVFCLVCFGWALWFFFAVLFRGWGGRYFCIGRVFFCGFVVGFWVCGGWRGVFCCFFGFCLSWVL